MKAYLVDPHNKSIDIVDYEGYDDIKQYLDGAWFDVVRLNDLGDVAYVDDEGLYRQPQSFWRYRNWPHPIAGKGLVLGTDLDTGETRSPMGVSSFSLADDITWLTPGEALEMAKVVSDEMEANAGPGTIVVNTYDIMKDQEYTE